MSLIGDLLRRLNPSDQDGLEDDDVSDAQTLADPAGSTRVERLLDRAEAEALAAFRQADLPHVPGIYHRAAGETAWTPVPDIAGPADRFAYAMASADVGGRHAGLAQIGRIERPDDPVILLASDLFGQVAAVRERLVEGGADASGRHDLEVAFELTMTWMRLCELAAAPAPKPRKAVSPPRRKTAPRSRKAAAGGGEP